MRVVLIAVLLLAVAPLTHVEQPVTHSESVEPQTVEEAMVTPEPETKDIKPKSKAKTQKKESINKTVKPVATIPTYSGDWVKQCKKWAKQAGVTLTPEAIELIGRESKCDPNVWNHSGSGAYGIAQALPASKLPDGVNTSPPEQIDWMHKYVLNRYGSWAAALNFHDIHNWY